MNSDSTPNHKKNLDRLRLSRQHLVEWQSHLKEEIQSQHELSQRHRNELVQLRAQPFNFMEQSVLIHQQVQALKQSQSANLQKRQAIRMRQEHEKAILKEASSEPKND